jgi:hypothetical protein
MKINTVITSSRASRSSTNARRHATDDTKFRVSVDTRATSSCPPEWAGCVPMPGSQETDAVGTWRRQKAQALFGRGALLQATSADSESKRHTIDDW